MEEQGTMVIDKLGNQFESLSCVAGMILCAMTAFSKVSPTDLAGVLGTGKSAPLLVGRPVGRAFWPKVKATLSLTSECLFLRCKEEQKGTYFGFSPLPPPHACYASTPFFFRLLFKGMSVSPPPHVLFSALTSLVYCVASGHGMWVLKMCHWRCVTAIGCE